MEDQDHNNPAKSPTNYLIMPPMPEFPKIPGVELSICIPGYTDVEGDGYWGGIIPLDATLASLIGPSSLGKTVILYRLASNSSQGTPFLGLLPNKEFKVLFLDLETSEMTRRFYLNQMGRNPNWAFYKGLETSLEKPDERKKLIAAAVKFGAEIILIDSLSTAWPVSDEDDNAIANLQMTGLFEIHKGTGALVLYVHHTGHSNLKRSRGAVSRINRPDLEILVEGDAEDDFRTLKVTKSRLRNLNMVVRFRLVRESYDFEEIDTLFLHVEPTVPRAKAALVRILTTHGKMKRKDAISILESENLSVNAIDRAKTILQKEGRLVTEGGYWNIIITETPQKT